MVENDFDFDSISMSGANLGGGDDGYVSQNDMEQEEEEDEIDTDYGSLVGIDEDFSVFENLDSREYDDYRFLLLLKVVESRTISSRSLLSCAAFQ
jgi:hypothetical protein